MTVKTRKIKKPHSKTENGKANDMAADEDQAFILQISNGDSFLALTVSTT
jgi:hypothetical protein